jgi:hypothetical protein
VVLHAHPVAEDGPAGERAGRVDGEHAHPVTLRAQRPDQLVRGGRLAHAGRAGQADDLRPAGVRRERRRHLRQQLVTRLDQGDQAGHRAGVALPGGGDQGRYVATAPHRDQGVPHAALTT